MGHSAQQIQAPIATFLNYSMPVQPLRHQQFHFLRVRGRYQPEYRLPLDPSPKPMAPLPAPITRDTESNDVVLLV